MVPPKALVTSEFVLRGAVTFKKMSYVCVVRGAWGDAFDAWCIGRAAWRGAWGGVGGLGAFGAWGVGRGIMAAVCASLREAHPSLERR